LIMRVRIGELRRIIREVVEESLPPGASIEERSKVFKQYSGEDNDVWEEYMRDDFMQMASGGQARGLRKKMFSHWRDEDFDSIVFQIDKIHGYV
jgi:hypothetical protein